jgi:hypothetical protein
MRMSCNYARAMAARGGEGAGALNAALPIPM